MFLGRLGVLSDGILLFFALEVTFRLWVDELRYIYTASFVFRQPFTWFEGQSGE